MSDSESNPTVRQHQWDASQASLDETWVQKRRLAAAVRLVIERLVPSIAPEPELRAAAEGLERYAERLKEHPRLRRVMGHAETANAGDVGAFFDQSPIIGLANPLAPPISLRRVGPLKGEGHARFGSAYEGPPGSVHGGFVAAAFDEVLGFVQSLGGAPGFTGTLTVRYRSPTPLHTDLLFTGELTRQEGRKTFAHGELRAGSQLCAEAEAIFVAAKPGTFDALNERRAKLEEELSG